MSTSSSTGIIDFLMGVDTPSLANAIETCGMREQDEGFTPLHVRALFPEMGRLCGYAVTAHVEAISRTRTGDMLHADENGVLQVPAAALDRLPDAVAAIRGREQELMEFLRVPQFTLAGLRGRIVE